MLPTENRMRRASEFSSVIRSGTRLRRGSVVVHHVVTLDQISAPSGTPDGQFPIIGLVVGRSVGNSVVRHRVSRRIRAQMAARLAQLPPNSATVVRALADCGSASSETLGRDLDAALAGLRRRTEARA